MKKFVKKTLIVLCLILGFAVTTISIFLAVSFVKYSSLALNSEMLTSSSLSIKVHDKNNDLLQDGNTFNNKYISLSSLPGYVPKAFISIEDKTFYSHNGVNPKRIAKAVFNNLKSMSYKEGASTISQQLIKNTHLSGEKTIDRKIREIALTKKLEKNFSKNEILEFYLNVIYFGNNNYGIEEAANYYFSKSSTELSVDEAALLAGIIKSPNKYSPIKHPDEALKRRNLVLNEMSLDKAISQSDKIKYSSTPLSLNISVEQNNDLNSYSEQAICEAIQVLKMPAKQIAIGEYQIYTYCNPLLQEKLTYAFENQQLSCDYSGIILDNSTAGVNAFVGKSAYRILEHGRQPGSLIKPVLVYAPALNENKITPETLILDDEINISGFSPKNVSGGYSGYVSVRDALSKSINVPAVKVLSYVGIDKAKSYAQKMGIKFDELDNSYALALGGMTNGTNVKEITNAYLPFSCGGKYTEAKFVHFITDKYGKVIYKHSPIKQQVMRDDTAYLMTDMLKSTAISGTARKLSSLNQPLAAKTGTVGISGQKDNRDAWNITFNQNLTCGVWLGNLDQTPISYSGGNEPTIIAKTIFDGFETKDFERPSSVTTREIDMIDLQEKHILSLSNSSTPERYKKVSLFSRFNEPNNLSTNFLLPPKPKYNIVSNENGAVLQIETKPYLTYKLFNLDEEKSLVYSLENTSRQEEITLKAGSYYLETAYQNSSAPHDIQNFKIENKGNLFE